MSGTEAKLVVNNAQLADSGVYQCFLLKEMEMSMASGRKTTNIFRSRFDALVEGNTNDDNVVDDGDDDEDIFANEATTSFPTSSSEQHMVYMEFIQHADVFINVAWPPTTLKPEPKTSTAHITVASKATEEGISTYD